MRFFLKTLVSLALSVALSVAPAMAYAADKEQLVKAAFLYNFTQFVEWPPHAYESRQSPFVIGILGENPFGNYLEELVKEQPQLVTK